ncbi:MAG: N-acetylmuramoyl-L-alanine amidase, partial [Clostridia bacterium]|nr:N-acetylmuramoyl-L-alanine amidase [Clostridia bacterium]
GENIQSAIIKMLKPQNERVIKKGNSSTYLLKNALIPAVIVECGFLSNKNELELLKSEEYQNKLAFCIFCGINNYFCKGDNNVTES